MVGPVVSAPPKDLWHLVGAQSCVEKEQFYKYFSDLPIAYGIVLTNVQDLGKDLTLVRLREEGFRPPQAWCRAPSELDSWIEAR